MLVAEAVGRALAAARVDTVFGVVGSGNFAVTNALVAGGARYLAARHECGAVMMADGYARTTGTVGVCTVHQGPGLTNALTGIAEAAKSRTPLLVLAADTPTGDLRSNFKVDQAGLAVAVGAVAERAATPGTAVTDALRALRRARVERRAVVLMLPLDVQGAPSPDRPPLRQPADPAPPRPAPAAVSELADLLQTARRPLLLAGRGAVLADAGGELSKLAATTGALLATSAQAHGLFVQDPWSLGICGGFATPVAAELVAASDLVVAFGASLTAWTTRHGALLGPAARVVQIDLELNALGANPRVDLAVLGDARETARDLLAELARRGQRSLGWRSAETAERVAISSARHELFEDRSDAEHIDPRVLSRELDEALPAERTVVVDSGHFMGYPSMYLRVPDAAGFVFAQGFQSVGLGLAGAIGAAVGRADRLTVAVLGDGGLLMGLAELETAARLALPMLVVVYNDAAYGAEVHHFGPGGAPLETVQFPDTDLAALARGAGADGLVVRRRADLAGLKRWLASARERPLLLDAKVVPTVAAEWLQEAFRSH